MNFDYRVVDKKGHIISDGDIVRLEVFEPKLCHNGIKLMLGRVISMPEYGCDNRLAISLGDDRLSRRQRRAQDVEVVSPTDGEMLFAQQKELYDSLFMLYKLES